MLNVFLFIPILIVSVRSTLLVIDNKVWIELMHFALKYYSILTWCNEQVNERVNVRLVKNKVSVWSAEEGGNLNDHSRAANG